MYFVYICAFRLSGDEVELACEFASTLAATIRFVWPTLIICYLPYWHMCDVELSHELRHVHIPLSTGVTGSIFGYCVTFSKVGETRGF